MNKEIDIYLNDSGSADDAQPDLETLLVVMRLAVGGAMEGADELLRRVQQKQEALDQQGVAAFTVFQDDATDLERLRFALLGLLFETPGVVARSLSTVKQNAERATNLVSKLASPIANSWPLRPVQRRYEKLVMRREALINRLAEIGRLEEQTGRALARETAVDTIDELLAYLAEKPEIRQLVQEQGLSMTQEVVQALRERTASADDFIGRLLRRRPSEPPPAVVDMAIHTASQRRATAESHGK